MTIQQSAEWISMENLTLRDQFAIAALTGILAHGCTHMDADAEAAYAFADAMLEARKPFGIGIGTRRQCDAVADDKQCCRLAFGHTGYHDFTCP